MPRHSSIPPTLTSPVVVTVCHAQAHHLGVVERLSLRGAFIETGTPLPFGTPVIVRATLSGLQVALPAIVRWRSQQGMGVHFTLLGARETYAITTSIRRAA